MQNLENNGCINKYQSIFHKTNFGYFHVLREIIILETWRFHGLFIFTLYIDLIIVLSKTLFVFELNVNFEHIEMMSFSLDLFYGIFRSSRKSFFHTQVLTLL